MKMGKITRNMARDLAVIAVVALIPCLAFTIRNGFSTIPVITELNVSPSFFLSNLFYDWHPYYEAGFDNSPSAWFAFPLGTLFAALNNVGMDSAMTSIFFMFMVYFLHGVSMYYLMHAIGETGFALPRFSKFVAAFFYMFNPFTLLYMHELGSQQLLASAILPLLLAFLIQGLFRKKLLYSIGIGLMSIFAGANVTFFVITLLVLLAYFLFDLVASRGKGALWKFAFLGVTLMIIFAGNMFWLLPRLSNITTEMNLAFREGESIGRSLALNSMASSYYETFRLLGSWSFQPAYFSYYDQFYSPIIIAATFAAPIFALGTLLMKPRNRFEIFSAAMVILCLPLAVGAYPPSNPHPTGIIYIWLYQNVPFFIIFRGAYKFVMVIALSYSTLIGLTWAKLSRIRFPRTGGKVLAFIGFGLVLLLLLGSLPSFYGQMVEKKSTFSIPQYYYDAAGWLENQGKNFRIMTIPEMRHVQYMWNNETEFTGTDVAVPIFKVPIIGRSYFLPLGSSATDEVTHELYRMIIANQTQDLAHALKVLNARYLMIHGDYKWGALEWNRPPSYLHDVLEKTPNITLVKSFGELWFYENELWSDSAVIAYVLSTSNVSKNLFASSVSDFHTETNQSMGNWKVEDGVFTSNDLYSYEDDVILSEDGFTNLTLTFKARSSSGHLHIYFFAIDDKNAYRLWINGTHYELGELVEGGFAVVRSENHNLSLNVSDWNSYEMRFAEGSVKVAVNGISFDIDHEDRRYVAGKIGFASPTSIVQISYVRLEYSSIRVDPPNIHSLSYFENNPTSYIVSMHNVSAPVLLIMTNSFNEGWNAHIQGVPNLEIQHMQVFDYANGWYVNRTGDFVITLEYAPQRFYDLGLKTSFLFFITCLIYLTFSYARNKPILKRIKTILRPNKSKTM